MIYLEKKKLAFMSIVNRIKGFVQSVSGTPPLTLYDCADNDSIINYTIEGNCVQDGEPSTDNPVEIQSVGDLVIDDTDEHYGKYKVPVVTGDSVINIYLDEPLRKAGDYADEIDFESSTIARHICSEFIDTVGSMSSLSGTYKIFMSDINHDPYLTSNGYVGYAISNMFKYTIVGYNALRNYGGYIQSYKTSGGNNCVAYTFNDESITSIKAAQEKIGDGFEVCYVLAEPEISKIELPTLATNRGTVIYDIDTSIKPNATVQYYSTSKAFN